MLSALAQRTSSFWHPDCFAVVDEATNAAEVQHVLPPSHVLEPPLHPHEPAQSQQLLELAPAPGLHAWGVDAARAAASELARAPQPPQL